MFQSFLPFAGGKSEGVLSCLHASFIFAYGLASGVYQSTLGYVHTAQFSFLSVFVDENAVLPHCSVSLDEYAMKTISVHTAPAKRCC